MFNKTPAYLSGKKSTAGTAKQFDDKEPEEVMKALRIELDYSYKKLKLSAIMTLVCLLVLVFLSLFTNCPVP